jgi:hypothetical protein
MNAERNDEAEELRRIEYLDVIGIQPIPVRKFGKDRGINATPTEAQQKEISKLASKLYFKAQDQTKATDDDADQAFDVLSRPRVILYEGKVTKKSKDVITLTITYLFRDLTALQCVGQTSMVQHQSKRYLYLLNDVLLVTSSNQSSMKSSSLGLNFSSDKVQIHNILYLNDIALCNPSWSNTTESSCTFEIVTADRTYEFTTESESDKRIWLEELEAAIFAVKLSNPHVLSVGWMHEIMLGTIFSAAYFGDVEMMTDFLKNSAIALDNHDANGMSALHWAALEGQVECVQLLINAGASIENLNSGLNTPLMLAASRGQDNVVLNLIAHEADIHVRNLKDRDALFMAVLYAEQSVGLYNIIQSLISHGIDVNAADASGSTALHECSSRNLSRSVMLLVDAGANVNLMHSRNGLTPLQLACTIANPDVETVRALLEKGAYPNWKDAAKRSSFDMILSGHKSRFDNMKVQDASAPNDAVDEVGVFVQEVLPILMELVRKGAKYHDESLASLRPSFREAIDSARAHWQALKEEEHFAEFVKTREVNLQASVSCRLVRFIDLSVIDLSIAALDGR